MKTKPYSSNFAMLRLENILLFADITVKKYWSTEESYFELTAIFPCGDKIVVTGVNLQVAIQKLDDQMRIYVNQC